MRGPGWSSVILLTVVISTSVSLAVQWAGSTGRLDTLWQGRREAAPAPEKKADTRPVPQLIGLPHKIAAELLKSRDLLMLVREEREDADIPKGAVLSQDPLPGSEMASGGQVSVLLSLGPAQTVEVPVVAGLSLEAAKAKLGEAGLMVGELRAPEGASTDSITRSEPAAGAKVPRDTGVDLIIEVRKVEVPKVVGLDMRKAKEAIEAAGLTLGKVRQRFDDLRPEWAVLSQKPEAGEKVEPGSVIDLVRNED